MEPALIPTPATEWKGKIALDGTDLELPSGNVARVKPMSPAAFLSSGLIPDPLTSLVRQSINSKQGLPPAKVAALAQNPDNIRSTLEMFDRLTCEVVIMPKVQMPPVCIECGEYDADASHGSDTHPYEEGDREPDVLYADNVDLTDKTFIFQWCMGGTRDLDRFREEQRTVVESVSVRKDVRGKAKRTTKR